MGIKYTREYEDIIKDLSAAIYQIQNFYEFFDITLEDWDNIPESEKKECAVTLADDIFYALGNNPILSVGDGIITHNTGNNIIIVSYQGTDYKINI